MKTIRYVMFCALLGFYGLQVQAVEPSSKPLPKPLQQGLQTLAGLDGFSCRFKQVIAYDDGNQQTFEGTLAVARPGHFRWAYEKPYVQLYVSNGQDVWFYEPDLMQVQHLQSLDAIDPTAMRLLEGRVQADEVQLISQSQEDGTPVYHIRIGQQTELWLALNAKALPRWFETRDALGNRNRMRLLSLTTERPKMQQFEFQVPEGVDILDADGQWMER